MTILPDSKTRAVDLGFLILIMAAANLLGLYSALPTLYATVRRVMRVFRYAVDTMFCSLGGSLIIKSYDAPYDGKVRAPVSLMVV